MRVAEYRNGGYYIGKTGENNTMQVLFPVGRWLQEYPNCMIRLAYKRPDMHDFYPAQSLEIVNGNAVWTVKDTDVEVQGEGLAELQMVLGEKIEKSKTFNITIEQAAVMGDTPSDPVKDYFLRMIDAAEKITAMTAEATTLEPGAEATASYDPDTGVMSFGIPAGEAGADGTDGFSPTASVTKVGKVATITITDKDGTTTETVSDGEDAEVPIDDTEPAANKVYSSAKVEQVVGLVNQAKPNLPDETPVVGKMMRIKSISQDGTITFEWANQTGAGRGLALDTNGNIQQGNTTVTNIANRTAYMPITCYILNPAVIAALTDTNHIVLDDTQKATAQSVIGIVTLTQEEYDLIDTPNPATIYIIKSGVTAE